MKLTDLECLVIQERSLHKGKTIQEQVFAAIREGFQRGWHAAAQPAQPVAREVAWLIETATGQYWCGGKCGWTPSPNLACRFARAEDAHAAREWLRIPPVDVRVTEHVWLDAALAQPAQPVARDWKHCTSRGHEVGELCDDPADCAKNGCARGRALAQPAQPVAEDLTCYEYRAQIGPHPICDMCAVGERGKCRWKGIPRAAPQPAPADKRPSPEWAEFMQYPEWRANRIKRSTDGATQRHAGDGNPAPSTPSTAELSDAECERIAQEVSRKHPNAGDQEYAWECIRAGRATVAEDAARLDWLLGAFRVTDNAWIASFCFDCNTNGLRAAIDKARGAP